MDDLIKLFRHVAVYGTGQIIGKVVAFLLIPLFTYYLSRADFGVMEVLNQASTLIPLALGLGVANAVTRFYYSAENDEEKKAVVSTGMVFGASVGLFVFIVCWLNADEFAKVLLGTGTPGAMLLVRLAAISVLFTFCADIGWTYLQTTQRSGLYVVLSQSFLLLSFALNIYLVVFRKLGVDGVFWSSALASASVAAALLFVTVRNVGFHFSAPTLLRLLRFGAPLTPAWVAAFIMNFSDRFFLQHARGLSEVGIYSVGYKFGFIVCLLIVQPFIMIWEPKSYQIAAKGDHDEVFSKIFIVYSTLLIFLALLISVPIREVFEIMVDKKFLPGYGLVPLIAFAYVAQGIGRFNEAGLLIRNRTHTLGLIALFSAVACLVGNFVMINLWGMWGAAVCTLVSFILFGFTNFIYSQRYYRINYDLPTLARVSAAAVCTLAVALIIPSAWPLTVRVGAKLLLLGAFVLMLPKLGVIGTDELKKLKDGLGMRWFSLRRAGSKNEMSVI